MHVQAQWHWQEVTKAVAAVNMAAYRAGMLGLWSWLLGGGETPCVNAARGLGRVGCEETDSFGKIHVQRSRTLLSLRDGDERYLEILQLDKDHLCMTGYDAQGKCIARFEFQPND